ncbi:unnamed protein product [Sphagnum tenellum]
MTVGVAAAVTEFEEVATEAVVNGVDVVDPVVDIVDVMDPVVDSVDVVDPVVDPVETVTPPFPAVAPPPFDPPTLAPFPFIVAPPPFEPVAVTPLPLAVAPPPLALIVAPLLPIVTPFPESPPADTPLPLITKPPWLKAPGRQNEMIAAKTSENKKILFILKVFCERLIPSKYPIMVTDIENAGLFMLIEFIDKIDAVIDKRSDRNQTLFIPNKVIATPTNGFRNA